MPLHCPVIDESGNFVRRPIVDFYQPQSSVKFSGKLLEFIFRFQTECVAECCGTSAFHFPAPETDNPQWQADETVVELLSKEQEKVGQLPTQLVSSPDLNQIMFKDELIAFLAFLEQGVKRVRAESESK